MHTQQWAYGAGWNEDAGRVIEPRNVYSRGQRISLKVQRGKPTVCMRRKAVVLGAVWRVCRTPPGSESGACLQRGSSGTWESQLSPCLIPGMGGPGDHKPWRGWWASTLGTSPVGTPRTTEAGKVSGERPRAHAP